MRHQPSDSRLRSRPSWCRTRSGGLALGALLLALSPAAAQQPQPGSQLPNPRLLTVLPGGGKAGTSVEVLFTGTDIEAPEGLIFSHPGIKAEAMVPPQPAGKAPTPPPQTGRRGMQSGPTVVSKFKVTIPADAPLGIHDVRLVNMWGVSNPRAFVVGELNEVLEKEPNNDVPEAQRVELNTTVNGNMANPTDVDYYVFAGKAGQRVVVSCLASSIDSRFGAGLECYDAAGRLLGESRDYQGNDALLDATLPADGDYYVRLYEFTHTQGTAEHYYRLTIGTGPWIDAVFPSSVEPGKASQVTVYGRNLPGGVPDPTAVVDGRVLDKVTVTVQPPTDPQALNRLTFSGHVPPKAAGLDGFEYRLKGPNGTSNPYLLTFAQAPVVLDNGANDTPETAQAVTLPCEIAGRVEKRRDRDWYQFTAKKGDVYNIEVVSDRIGAATDMVFYLRHLEGKQDLGEFDDDADSLSPSVFFTRSNDPARLRFEAKADGTYQLLVKSQDGEVRAGPRHLYRVQIARERPDFRLIVLPPDDKRPDSCRLLRGGEQYLTVLAWRQDGFAGPIELAVEGLPKGVTAPTQAVGPDLKQASFVVSAAADAPEGVFPITLKGTATINGQKVVREARPASITWPLPPQQQNIPAVSRLDRNLVLAVNEQAPFRLTTALAKDAVVQGDKAELTVKMARIWPDMAKVQVTATALDLGGPNGGGGRRRNNQPADLTVNNNQPITLAPGKDEIKVPVEIKAAADPGTYNIVLRATAQVPYNKDPMNKQKPNTNIVLPSTAATLTVLPKELAKLTLPMQTVGIKAGAQGEVVVKVARLYGYAGEFKVQLVLPPNLKGLTAPEVTIPAGQDEAKLVVKAAPDAPQGAQSNLVVRAVALYDGKVPTTQEAKLTVTVTK